MTQEFQLFTDKKNCCGCGACYSVCPKNAIKMTRDEDGFIYPEIDRNQCVLCGKCLKVCAFSNGLKEEKEYHTEVFASATKNQEIKSRSTSGGIFAQLASAFLQDKGVVYGVAWQEDKSVKHVSISSLDELYKLQGSKYLQSRIDNAYVDVKTALDEGKKVLFSGTPCQVAGLKSYLNKDYENLYTVDLICHGVSNDLLFKEDIKYQVKRYKIKGDAEVEFRAKDKKWELLGSIKTENKNYPFNTSNSPYYYYFLKGSIYRESCYNCPYACEKRVGDITLGDYWGVKNAHPNVEDSVKIDNGVSCVLVNTEKGKRLFDGISDKIDFVASTMEKAKVKNAQLSHSSKKPINREKIFEVFHNDGYKGVVKYWKKTEKKTITAMKIKILLRLFGEK